MRFPPPLRALPPPEAALVLLTSAHLIFLPWALGTMHAWSQCVSLGAAAAGLALALAVPAPRPDDPAKAAPAAPLLIRSPVFWLGAAVLAYVFVQACNPAWRFITNGRSWWLAPRAHNEHLPSGIDAPFSRFNAWRELIILASAWLLACSIAIGFRHRASFRVLLVAIVANGLVLGSLGLAQVVTGATRIFGSYVPSNDLFFASFIYRNHGGAYFNLVAAIAAGLALRHFSRLQHRRESPARTMLFAFAAGFLMVVVIFSYSRMATVLVGALAAGIALCLGFAGRRGSSTRERRERWLPFLFLMAMVAVASLAFRSDTVWKHFADLVGDPTASLQDRALVRRAAGDMYRDRWVWGWGAGSFRYAFPIYAQREPAIYHAYDGNLRYWEHAHDDLLEFPIEFGLVGVLPLLGLLGCAAVALGRGRFWRHPLPLCLALGCMVTLLHAWLDFVFQCPAVLLTWTAMLTTAACFPWVAATSSSPAATTSRHVVAGHPV